MYMQIIKHTLCNTYWWFLEYTLSRNSYLYPNVTYQCRCVLEFSFLRFPFLSTDLCPCHNGTVLPDGKTASQNLLPLKKNRPILSTVKPLLLVLNLKKHSMVWHHAPFYNYHLHVLRNTTCNRDTNHLVTSTFYNSTSQHGNFNPLW